MKRKLLKNKYIYLRYLILMLPFLAFTFCQDNDVQTVDEQSQGLALTNEATLLMKSSVTKSTEEDEPCIEYQYPMEFYYYFSGSRNIQVAVIYNDEELFDFFDMIKDADEIRIDFPITLYGDLDDEDPSNDEIKIENIEDLISTLQIAVDACRGSELYDYCDNDNKKVNICHNGNTLCVSVSAIQAHLDHGDVLGTCD